MILYNYRRNFGVVLLSRLKAFRPAMIAKPKSFGYDMIIRPMLLGSDKELSRGFKINSHDYV